MYDNYPKHDVPQENLIQRFFAQRWSAILLEIVMTIVITVAAGAAFDFFDPLDGRAEPSTATAPSEEARLDADAPKASDPLEFIKARGIEYSYERRLAAAEAMFDWAVALAPEDAGSYAWRGYVKMQSGDYIGAESDYGRLVELRPASFDGHNALCWAYGETGKFDLALTHCDLALNAAGSPAAFASALENRCWAQVELGAYEAAERDCLRALALLSDCGEVCALAHFNLGRVMLARGRALEALSHFDEARRVGSSYAKMYLDIGDIYATLGYQPVAQASYKQYRRLTGGAETVARG